MSKSLRDKFRRNAEEFIRNAQEFDALMEEMLEENDRLTAERDALAASNARLREAIVDATNNGSELDNGKWVYSIDDGVLEETPAQSLAHIQAQGMQTAAEICEDLYMGTYEGCEEHHYTDNCAEAIEAAKKELKGDN